MDAPKERPPQRRKETKLHTLSEAEALLLERSQDFTVALNNFLEVVKKVYEGRIDPNLGVDEKGNFTGNNLCLIAADALCSGASRLMEINEIQAWRVFLTLNPVHSIAKIIDMQSKDFILADPAYKQVNSSFHGGILVIHPDEIGKYYPPEITNQPIPIIKEGYISPYGGLSITLPKDIVISREKLIRSIGGKESRRPFN